MTQNGPCGIVALLVVLSGCAPASASAPSAPGAVQRPVEVERLVTDCCSSAEQPMRVVVREPGAWRDLWASLWRDRSPLPPLPAVDFGGHMVIVAAMGTRSTGGATITIESVEEGPAGLTVRVLSVSPGPDCLVTAAITHPVDVVRVPRRPGSVNFVERQEARDCG